MHCRYEGTGYEGTTVVLAFRMFHVEHLTHSRSHALTHSRTHALTHSRTHALTHSRTHALTHSRTSEPSPARRVSGRSDAFQAHEGEEMLTRRAWLKSLACGVGMAALGGACASDAAAKPGTKILVYKSPTCGCCRKWVDHLTDNGFEVTSQDVPDVNPIKERYGIPAELASCHT